MDGEQVVSVLRKVLNKEFGKERFEVFSFLLEKSIRDEHASDRTGQYIRLGKITASGEVYDAIYQTVQEKDRAGLIQCLQRLTEAMTLTVRICRQYIMAVIFYIVISLFLISLELLPVISLVALILISLCFLYKTYEFVVNKFCYFDVCIAFIYKEVLESLLSVKHS